MTWFRDTRYGSRTSSHAQLTYMMWWQSARVTQRRECRGLGDQAGAGRGGHSRRGRPRRVPPHRDQRDRLAGPADTRRLPGALAHRGVARGRQDRGARLEAGVGAGRLPHTRALPRLLPRPAHSQAGAAGAAVPPLRQGPAGRHEGARLLLRRRRLVALRPQERPQSSRGAARRAARGAGRRCPSRSQGTRGPAREGPSDVAGSWPPEGRCPARPTPPRPPRWHACRPASAGTRGRPPRWRPRWPSSPGRRAMGNGQ